MIWTEQQQNGPILHNDNITTGAFNSFITFRLKVSQAGDVFFQYNFGNGWETTWSSPHSTTWGSGYLRPVDRTPVGGQVLKVPVSGVVSVRRRRHRLTRLALGGALLLTVVSCAEGSAGSVEAGPDPAFDSPALDFEAPLGAEGEAVSDVSAAGLPFTPVAPDIGREVKAFVSSPPQAPEAAIVGLVYEDPSWDRIVVFEYVDTRTQADLLAWEEKLVERVCVAVPEQGPDAVSCSFDPFTQVDIGGGVVALLGATPEEQEPALTTIEWIQPFDRTKEGADLGPEFQLVVGIQGYASTFSREEAVAFAKQMVASQG